MKPRSVFVSNSKRRLIVLLFALWFLFLASLLAYFLRTAWLASYALAAENSINEARILANSLDASLRRINGLLDWMEATLRDDEDLRHIQAELTVLAAYFPELVSVGIHDSAGGTLASSAATGCLDPEEYAAHFSRSSSGLNYSDTLQCSHTGSRIVLVFRKSGSGPGLFLAAALNLAFYEAYFSLLKVGQHGVVSFRRSDTSQLLVRWPVSEGMMNNLAPGIPPQLAINDGVRNGVVRYVGGTDGVERIFAFQQLDTYPFYALVGRETGDVFSSWRKYSALASAATLLLLCTSGYFLFRLESSLRQKNLLINELLHRTNNSLQLVLSLVQLAIFEDSAGVGAGADGRLRQLLSRIGCLGLAQAALDPDCSSVSLGTLLQSIADKEKATGTAIAVEPPEQRILLDCAAPLALILNELFRAVQAVRPASGSACPREDSKAAVDLRAISSAEILLVSFRHAGIGELSESGRELVEALCLHQLGATFELHEAENFECTIAIPLTRYKNRLWDVGRCG